MMDLYVYLQKWDTSFLLQLKQTSTALVIKEISFASIKLYTYCESNILNGVG